MSRIAQVIVLAPYADEVMAPLTLPDDSRTWCGEFEQLSTFVEAWVIEFNRMRPRTGLLRHLESLPWPHPESVQVLIHDEEDDCFGLWMMQDSKLTELRVPGHTRLHPPAPPTDEFPPSPGLLWRTDTPTPTGFSPERQDPRPAW
ncbi:hypothetical protein [Kitasatospora aureofaciens]|uniref:hypothetical protein n=1 Tax=Kitasatospora aureofaciens TaxID=1894 RepID=UPI001C45DB75|nr:hypothetical protein [Kitasatospora aureofaciens]MBV6702737.1 hypothetical protein [Kitasatospora aureofaciens]